MAYFQPALGYDDLFLSIAQQRAGHAVTIITSDRYRPFPDYASTVEPILGPRRVGEGRRQEAGLDTIRLPVLFEVRTQVWLRRLRATLRSLTPDVIHLHGALSILGGQTGSICRTLGYTLVADSHHEPETFWVEEPSRRAFFAALRLWCRPRLLRGARAFAAINPASQIIFARELGLASDAVRVIPLGADTERFRFDPEARRRTRAELGIPPEAVTAIYAGKAIPDKDVHVLAEAFVRAAARRPELWLLLVGSADPAYRRGIEQTLEPVSARVRWRPPVPNAELPGCYAAADIGVWPSESSNAMIEAAAVGLPLVVADTAATADRIANGNGIGVARGDVGGFAAAIERLAADKTIRHAMGRRGRELVEREMSWDALARRWEALYDTARQTEKTP